jgi:sterol desaturase/sphingolipid hydroxylase (fatty acid hydroxylase superfamily)
MNEFIHEIMDKKGILILIGIFGLLFIVEGVFQLRRRVQKRWSRVWINTLVSIPAFAALRFLFLPLMVWIAIKNQSWQFGINYLFEFPYWIEFAIGFVLLDYSNYIWHIMLHKVPVLWRFHLVHHSDLDLDLTTAIRFHFGEMIGSIFFRGFAIWLIGASPLLVLVYEIAFEAATQFHQSNWKLPFRFEKLLNKLIVTPRMHGIHHSIIKDETDKNYSIIFSFWDRLHRTVKLNIHQDDIVIGVPSYHDADELTVGFLLKMPFLKVRPWGNTAEERNKGEREVMKK